MDFKSKYGLSSHVNSKHKAVPTEYKCDICGEGNLFSPQARVKHKRKRHPKEVEEKKHTNKINEVHKIPHYECSYCGVKFPKRLERDRHQNFEHGDNSSNEWKCNCGVTAITEKRLLYHKENTCTLRSKKLYTRSETIKPFMGTKQFKCSECNKTWATLFRLQSHIKSVHEGVREQFKCSKCNNTLATLSGLKTHIKTVHEGVREECPHCNKSLSLSHIKLHIKIFHSHINI